MNLEKQTVKMTVRKIVKKESIGVLLYNLFFSVPSIRSKSTRMKQANIVGPVVCVTSKHSLPTTNGYKIIEDIKVGDIILYSLDLVTK